MRDVLEIVFSSPWTFLGTVLLLTFFLSALALVCFTVAAFAPKAPPPAISGRGNPWM